MSCAAEAVRPLTGVVRISFAPHAPGVVCRLAEGVEVEEDTWYLVDTEVGQRLGRVARFALPVWREGQRPAAGTVLRPATSEEIERHRELENVERDSLRFCRQWAADRDVAMQPVEAVVPMDRNHLLVTFSADQRVDFRDLLRELGRRSRRRVELRQIGVRDQAKTNAGWGPCGRPLCCTTFMERFTSVTIRMAKAQNLSLNPSRISGMCGRLMCCLNHEMTKKSGADRRRGS